MSGFLSEKEIAELVPSELCPYQTPIPTQIVSSDEYYPDPQSEKQREVEARLLAMADDLGKAGPRSRVVSAGRFGIGARYCVLGCSAERNLRRARWSLVDGHGCEHAGPRRQPRMDRATATRAYAGVLGRSALPPPALTPAVPHMASNLSCKNRSFICKLC